MLDVRQRLAGECPSLGLERGDLGREPAAPRRFVDLGRDPIEEGVCVVEQPSGRPQRLEIDLRLEVGRPEVAVDETGDPLVQPEGEEEVVAGDRIRRRYGRLAADRRDERTRGRIAIGGHRGSSPMPWPGATPPSSPRNGMPWRSTASRLIRRAAVFAAATSRT